MMPPFWLLAACSSGARDDSTAEAPEEARVVYDGALPDCGLGFSEAVLCAHGGSVPGTTATTAQVNLVPDWYWRRGEPSTLHWAGSPSGASEAPCADDAEAALAVHASEVPSEAAFVTGTDDSDPRWIDVLRYGEGDIGMPYRVPRCAVYARFAGLGRLRFADSHHIDPLWELRDPPAEDRTAWNLALIDALDLVRIVESHRATIALAGTDQTLLYAVGSEILDDVVRYRTCRVDGAGYRQRDGWAHGVWQVEYTIDLAAGRATLDQGLVGTANCDDPIGSGIW